MTTPILVYSSKFYVNIQKLSTSENNIALISGAHTSNSFTEVSDSL